MYTASSYLITVSLRNVAAPIISQTGAVDNCSAVQQVRKLSQRRRDPDALRAYLFAAAASAAGLRPPVLRQGGDALRGVFAVELRVEQREQRRNIQILRAFFHAIVAGGAGYGGAAAQLLRNVEQRFALLRGKRTAFRHGGDIAAQLVKVRHSGKHHADPIDSLQEAERPRGNAFFGPQRAEPGCKGIVQRGKPAAAHRLGMPRSRRSATLSFARWKVQSM